MNSKPRYTMKSALLTSPLALAATAQAETNPFFVFDNGLRIALYPHVNAWLHRLEDALRVVKKVNRQNVGLTFNLCHALMDGAEPRIPALIAEAAPHLFVATLNGADRASPRSP